MANLVKKICKTCGLYMVSITYGKIYSATFDTLSEKLKLLLKSIRVFALYLLTLDLRCYMALNTWLFNMLNEKKNLKLLSWHLVRANCFDRKSFPKK